MSDGELLPTVLSSPKNSGHQQVTAPKLLFLTDDKPTAISNEGSSNKSSPKETKPEQQDIPSLKESPISIENQTTSRDMIMSPDLAQEFENIEQLPGISFLQDSNTGGTEPTCIIILHHTTLKLTSKMKFITQSTPISISQIINVGEKPSYRPHWKAAANRRICKILNRISNELGAEPALINKIDTLAHHSGNEFFEPCQPTEDGMLPKTPMDLLNDLNRYKDKTKPFSIHVMLTNEASHIFGTIVRSGIRELASVRSTASSKRSRGSKHTHRSPVKEIEILRKTENDQTAANDELTHDTQLDKQANDLAEQKRTHKKTPDWIKHVNASQSRKEQDNDDPQWDSNDRKNFSYRGGTAHVHSQRHHLVGYKPPASPFEPPSYANSDHTNGTVKDSHDPDPSDPSNSAHGTISATDGPSPYPEGPHWTHFVINPFDDIVADPQTGSIRPWYAIKHELGRTLNFPLNLGNLQIDKDMFLAQFVDVQYDHHSHFKAFASRFPTFPEDDSGAYRHNIIPFLYQVTQHCVGFGVYVPPPHTLRPGDKFGAWRKELPIWTQRQILSVFDNLLAQALRQKSTSLLSHKRLGALVRTPKQGYDMIMALAIEAGHPSLQQFPETPKEPRQGLDMSIVKYVDAWSQYLQRMILTGHHYNDRFFFQQLLRNCHSAFKPIFKELQYSVREHSSRKPLPPSFHMSSLITKITQLAQFIDSRVDISISAKEMTKNMRTTIQQLKVAQMTTPGNSSTAHGDSPGVRCFLCGENHPLRACPQLKTLLENDKGKASLRRILETQQLMIREIGEDVIDTHADEDNSCDPPDEDNEAYDTPAEEDSDFRESG